MKDGPKFVEKAPNYKSYFQFKKLEFLHQESGSWIIFLTIAWRQTNLAPKVVPTQSNVYTQSHTNLVYWLRVE